MRLRCRILLTILNHSEGEITSESAAHPIESGLISGSGAGWQAAEPEEQTIRLIFDSKIAASVTSLRQASEI